MRYEEINNRTYRGFTTQEDAQTFKNFLQTEGYEEIDMMEFDKTWKVFFKERHI
jgi:hypothetical protein